MKTLYLECAMGAAGDMLLAALLELMPDPEDCLAQMNAFGIPGVHYAASPSEKCGITGTHLTVTVGDVEEESIDEGQLSPHTHTHEHDHLHEHEHTHTHAGFHGISHTIHHLHVSPAVREHALAVYRSLAEAESHVHGKPVEEIHFHEVGTMDAIADIVGVCYLLDRLAPEKICASAIHVGCGQVRCAHGILPVPAPATAYLLRDIPVYGGAIQGELCTPTGAALLRYFAKSFGKLPPMRIGAIGCGMGKKDFPAANCVRAMLGETDDGADEIWELSCNLDDMTPQSLGYAMERLFEGGALDVFTTPISMKKNRPAVMLTCLCRDAQRDAILHLFFRHTSTLGVRQSPCTRAVLDRTQRMVATPYGDVRVKQASGWGVFREKPEYDDIAAIAHTQGLSIAEVEALVSEQKKP